MFAHKSLSHPKSRTTRTVAALALIACSVALVLPWSAAARPIDDPALPSVAEATAETVASEGAPESIVTPEVASPTDANTPTVAIALSSAALFVAVAGAGYMVVTSKGLRRSPSPGA